MLTKMNFIFAHNTSNTTIWTLIKLKNNSKKDKEKLNKKLLLIK